MRPIAFVLAIILGLSGPTRADRLGEAVAAWLALDDATALPLLAELADGGDDRAMLLLGAIDLNGVRSDFLNGLDRTESNAIMRLPGGKFRGPSRLTAVTGDLAPVARALLGDNDPMAFRERATTLLEAGEIAAATPLLMTTFNQNPADLLIINATTPIPERLRYFLWEAAAYTKAYGTAPEGIDLTAIYSEATAPDWQGSLQQRIFLGGTGKDILGFPLSDSDRLLSALAGSGEIMTLARQPGLATPTSPETLAIYDRAAALVYDAAEVAPLRALCEASCPEAPQDCVMTVYSEVGGYPIMVLARQPLSLLIPDEAYFSSPCYLSDLRAVALPPGLPRPDGYAARAQCGQSLLRL